MWGVDTWIYGTCIVVLFIWYMHERGGDGP